MHTPGPWTYEVQESLDCCSGQRVGMIVGANRQWIADIFGLHTNHVPHEFNAALIAAAPDMLEALQAVARDHLDVVLAKQVRAAIAKAEGK